MQRFLIPYHFIGLICLTWILLQSFFGVGALKCITCDPCDNDNKGTSETCDPVPYENLPDPGKMACSYETKDASGAIKKRCQFLRQDPDTDKIMELSQCFKSPFDESKEDCLCFKDDCNKEKPKDEAKNLTEANTTKSGGHRETTLESSVVLATAFLTGAFTIVWCAFIKF